VRPPEGPFTIPSPGEGASAGTSLVSLLHLCDSLFPIGAFAHSDGLEAATSSGSVSTGADLLQWLTVTLDETLRHCEGPAVRLVCEAFVEGRFADVLVIDAELDAIRPSSTQRRASLAMGTRLLSTWQLIRPHDTLDAFCRVRGFDGVRLPTGFAVVCASAQIPCRATLEGLFYTRLAATVSSAMRLMAIGQAEAHGLLARTLNRVPCVVDGVLQSHDPPHSFTPALDIAAMSQQYVGSRLFRS